MQGDKQQEVPVQDEPEKTAVGENEFCSLEARGEKKKADVQRRRARRNKCTEDVVSQEASRF